MILRSAGLPAAPCAVRPAAAAPPRAPAAARGLAPRAGGAPAAPPPPWPAALPAGCLAGALLARRRGRRAAAARRARGGFEQGQAPADLYELLGVRRSAAQDEIRSAYRSKLKISHPDVAGEESSELMVLLNDAYRVLGDPGERRLYDGTLPKKASKPSKPKVEVSTDFGPTWKRSRDPIGAKPEWRGTPRSTSYWAKLKEEDRGEMWEKQMYVYVDPWHCVSCNNCFDAAPKTFMMNNKHGKAQAYNQWGDPEVEISWAIDACPVDCISWVTREELQVLEHVTARELYETNGEMLCAMQIQQGTISADTDPWDLADQLRRKLKREEAQAKETMADNASRAADTLQRRIEKVFSAMAHELKLLGWPTYALPPGRS